MITGAAAGVAGLTLLAAVANAQLQLPGASFKRDPVSGAGQPGDTSGSPGSKSSDAGSKSLHGGRTGAAANVARPVILRPPSEKTLIGIALMHNGRRGLMKFEESPQGMSLTRLELGGDVISRPGETCKVTVPGAPFSALPVGVSAGLRKYQVNLKKCAFTFTVLDKALIARYGDVTASTGLGAGTCQFQERDCRGYLAGIWGPSGRSFAKNTARLIEKARGKSERDARANFRALLRAAAGDKKRVSEVAADQAGFSARREVRCRDFLNEHKHGFCASRITEARGIELGVRLNEMITTRTIEAAKKTTERNTRRRAKRERR